MIVDIILINETQLNWINNYNISSNFKAIPCDYGTGNCILAEILTEEGYESLATYLSGSAVSQVEINSPFEK